MEAHLLHTSRPCSSDLPIWPIPADINNVYCLVQAKFINRANLTVWRTSMENIPATTSTLQALSRDLAEVVEQVSPAVVAVNARRSLSSSAVYWREGVVVTAAHTLRRTDDISVIL